MFAMQGGDTVTPLPPAIRSPIRMLCLATLVLSRALLVATMAPIIAGATVVANPAQQQAKVAQSTVLLPIKWTPTCPLNSLGTNFCIPFQTQRCGQMSKCVYRIAEFCSIGKFDGRPTDDDCASCSAYKGACRGLGDTVNTIAEKTGVKRVANIIEKKTGKPCGCGKRRAKLNKMFPAKEDS